MVCSFEMVSPTVGRASRASGTFCRLPLALGAEGNGISRVMALCLESDATAMGVAGGAGDA